MPFLSTTIRFEL